MAQWKVNDSTKFLYILVAGFLGLITLGCLFAIFLLAFYGKTAPDALIVLSSVSVGALASLFPSASSS